MIRIFMEAKENFDSLVRLIFVTRMKAMGIKLDDKQIEQAIAHEISNYQTMNEYKRIRSQLPPPQNDVTYWYNTIKNGGVPAIEEFERTVMTFEVEKEAKKMFAKLYPSSSVRRFNQNKNRFPTRATQTYDYWVEQAGEIGINDAQEKLRKMLKDVVGYSDYEKEQIEKGSELVFNKNGWKIYRITGYLASEYYGQGTGWCICGNYQGRENRGEKHFNDYIQNTNPYGYFFALCDDGRKYCFYVEEESDEDGFELSQEVNIWRGTDGADVDVINLPGDFPREFCEQFEEEYDVELPLSNLQSTVQEQIKEIETFFDECGFVLFSPHIISIEPCIDIMLQKCHSTKEKIIRDDVTNNLTYFYRRWVSYYTDVLFKYCRENNVHYDDLDDFDEMSFDEQRNVLVGHRGDIEEQLCKDNDTYYDYLKWCAQFYTNQNSDTFIARYFTEEFELTARDVAELVVESGQGQAAVDYITT